MMIVQMTLTSNEVRLCVCDKVDMNIFILYTNGRVHLDCEIFRYQSIQMSSPSAVKK